MNETTQQPTEPESLELLRKSIEARERALEARFLEKEQAIQRLREENDSLSAMYKRERERSGRQEQELFRREGFPDFFIKAMVDPFDYLVVLKGGDHLLCESMFWSESSPAWVHLTLQSRARYHGHPCPRGLDVRISEIVAIVDAPDDS